MDFDLRDVLNRSRARMDARARVGGPVRGEHGAGDSQRCLKGSYATCALGHPDGICHLCVSADPAAERAHSDQLARARRDLFGRPEGELPQGPLHPDPDPAAELGAGPPNRGGYVDQRPLREEMIENLRRIAERGLRFAQETSPQMVDIWQHLLDELERLRRM